MIRLVAHIRTIIVLAGGKLIEFYFLYILVVIYYSIMTHLDKIRMYVSFYRVM
jgi:hypothetical protein